MNPRTLPPLLTLLILTACNSLETRPLASHPASSASAGRPAQIAAADGVAAPRFKPGQQWTYRRIDLWRNEESERFRQELLFEDNGHWLTRWTILDSTDATRRGSITGEIFDPNSHGFADARIRGRPEPLRFDLAPGKAWSYDYSISHAGRQTTIREHAKVIGWENLTLPAGRFRALRVDHHGEYFASEAGYSWSGRISESYWYAPQAGRVVLREYQDTKGDGSRWDHWREELLAAKL